MDDRPTAYAPEVPTNGTHLGPPSRRRAHLLLCALIVATAALWLFRHMERPLTGDSVRYAAIARRMVESGDWVQPRVMDILDWWKPPLSYWLVAASFEVLGPTPFASMIPSTLAGVALVLLVFLVMERLAGPLAGVAASLLILFTPGFAEHTVTCRLESLLQLLTLLALVALERARARPAWFLAFWALVGAAVLTKSGAGLVPVLVLALTALVTRRAYPFDRPRFWTAVVAGLLVAGPWYAVMSWRNGGEFWATHFGREIAGRAGVGSAANVARSLWASLAFAGALAVLAPIGAFLAARDARRDARLARLAAFAGIWIAFILVTQALNNAAYPRYMYNAFVPLAGFAGYGIAALFARRLPAAAPVVAVVAALLVAVGARIFDSGVAERHLAQQAVLDRIAGDPATDPVLALVKEPEQVETFLWFHLHRSTRYVPIDSLAEALRGRREAFAGRLALVDDRGWDALDPATVDVVQRARVFSLVRFR